MSSLNNGLLVGKMKSPKAQRLQTEANFLGEIFFHENDKTFPSIGKETGLIYRYFKIINDR